MRTTWKGTALLVAGGLMLAGLAYAATYPSLTPIGALKEPVVKVKTAVGTIKTLGTSSIVVHTTKADYTFTLNDNTTYYIGNGVPAGVTDLKLNDAVTVWSLSLTNGSAVKVWDRRPFSQPNVTVSTLTGTLTSKSKTSLSVTVTVGTKATVYNQLIVPGQTVFYTRDGKVTDASFVLQGDAVTVKTLKTVDGIAISVWDRKIWSGSLTRTISALVSPVGNYMPDEATTIYGSFTLTKANVTSAFKVVGLATTVYKNKAGTTVDWALANGMLVKVDGMWNDVQKTLYATTITNQ